MRRSNSTRQLAFCGLLVGAACSSPTTPPTPPPGSDNQQGGTGTAAALTLFAAEPATITEGETFTLRWEGTGGQVTLARKGEALFAVGLPSRGTHALSAGKDGYPTGPGITTYVAMIGDVATRRETTVTVQAASTTPTNDPPHATVTSTPASCYPTPADGCSTTCTATASDPNGDPLSYTWSGCASGSGTTATCTVSQPGVTCTVEVRDGQGGSTTASAAMVGRNEPPSLSNPCCFHDGACRAALPPNHPYDGEPKIYLSLTDDAPNPKAATTCTAVSIGGGSRGCNVVECRNVGGPASISKVIDLSTLGAGRTCSLDVTTVDEWGAQTTTNFACGIE